jgi:AcrR family transcriptional regulator
MENHEESSAKQRILKAAIALTEERSAQFVQLRDIAKAAGVSPSLILFHFASREDLLLEVRFVRWEELGVPELMEWRRDHPNADLETVLEALFARDLRRGHRSRDFMSMGFWWSTEDEKRFQRLLQLRLDIVHEALAKMISDAAKPELDQVTLLIKHAYTGVLREAHILGLSASAAAKTLLTALAPALAGLERNDR